MQSARLHVAPGANAGVHMETSGTFTLNPISEGENTDSRALSSGSAENQGQFGG